MESRANRRQQHPADLAYLVIAGFVMFNWLFSEKTAIELIVEGIIVGIFVIVLGRISVWLFPNRRHLRPLRAWFYGENFEIEQRSKSATMPVGEKTLWFVVGPRIATKFDLFNLRFVKWSAFFNEARNWGWGDDNDEHVSIVDVELHPTMGFPGVKCIDSDKFGGKIVVLNEPFLRTNGDYLNIILKVKTHKPWSGHLSFRAVIGTEENARKTPCRRKVKII